MLHSLKFWKESFFKPTDKACHLPISVYGAETIFVHCSNPVPTEKNGGPKVTYPIFTLLPDEVLPLTDTKIQDWSIILLGSVKANSSSNTGFATVGCTSLVFSLLIIFP